jgi:hypothetical protein
MATWKIDPQEEGKGDERHEVLCKHVEFFPSDDREKYPNGFGRHKMPILRVNLKCVDTGSVHRLTWSNYAGDTMDSTNPGKFVYHWPDRQQYRMIKKRGCRDRADFWSPKETVPGDTKEFVVHEKLWQWLGQRCGVLVAAEVKRVWEERLIEFLTQSAKKAA